MKSIAWIGLTIATIAAVAAYPTVFGAAAARALVRPDRGSLAFRDTAGGTAAYRDAEWRLDFAPPGAGLIVGAAICGDDAFLLDRQRALVHHVDLRRRIVVDELGASTGAALRTPSGLAADCPARRLYVVDSTGVVAIDADSGAPRGRFRQPSGFTNSTGSAILDVGSHTLSAPGLWSPAESMWQPTSAVPMFDGSRIGYRLDLETGAVARLVPAIDRGCWSLGPNCVYASLDRVRTPAGGWIAAHRVSVAVGVFDPRLQLLRTIDVRSPMFLDSGTRNTSKSIVDMVAWNERNSVIRDVFSFGDTIATVHSFNRTRGWKPGQPTEFEVFMNLHALDGRGLVSDVRLPDLPVGRDETSLYIVDYGSTGHRPLGHESITLVRMPVHTDRTTLAEP
jgi:hypothetical protein